jgi:hypothetical protein
MAEVVKKRQVLNVTDKVIMTRQIETGKKKADVCQECGLVSYTIQNIWKNCDKFVNALKKWITN